MKGRKRKSGLTPNARRALELILENPGKLTMVHIALFFDEQHSIYGRQRAASRAIAELRREGYIEDCPRCPTCGRATSRWMKNVLLYPIGYTGPRMIQQTFL